MQKYWNNVAGRSGRVIAGATVTVTNSATGAPAALYSDNGVTRKLNPVVTDVNGYFDFYAADGRYNIAIGSAGASSVVISDVILEDPADGASGGGTIGTGGGVVKIPFAAVIPLSTAILSIMDDKIVTGPITLTTSATRVAGAQVIGGYIADGTNKPTEPAGSLEDLGSSGYDNRSGIRNRFQLLFDGVELLHSWSQALGAVAIVPAATAVTISPTSASGVVGAASSAFTVGTDGARAASVVVTPTPITGVTFTPTSVTLAAGTGTATFTANSSTTGAKSISLTNNASLANPAAITYTVVAAATAPGAPTLGAATAGAGSATVTVVAPASDGGSAILSYTVTATPGGATGTLSGSAGGAVTITGLTAGTSYQLSATATNGVGTSAASALSNAVVPTAVVSYIQLAPKGGDLTLTGTGPYGYNGTGAGFVAGAGGVANKALQSGVDGSLSLTFTGYTGTSGSTEIMIGVGPTATLDVFTSLPYVVYTKYSTNEYTPFTSGTQQAPTNSMAPINGDIFRPRRSGSTLVIEVARAGTPTVFTPIYTWTGVPTSVLYFHVFVGTAPGSVGNFVATGLA
jgi:hypothetical protein